jgi:hypothetical protein
MLSLFFLDDAPDDDAASFPPLLAICSGLLLDDASDVDLSIVFSASCCRFCLSFLDDANDDDAESLGLLVSDLDRCELNDEEDDFSLSDICLSAKAAMIEVGRVGGSVSSSFS